ncbi:MULTISPECIES: hypothetical protein [unclassified Streptomyces]|uniref:hypothetical protein n=1 Tax=unclassified Streptomyces TaxID=2593676 RepID=UPI00131C5689|nr:MULTISPECIES: hypothetical protein [unclassified Streptomyces]MYX18897.1 hypothetical protein [Streptomyces sp. SID8380]
MSDATDFVLLLSSPHAGWTWARNPTEVSGAPSTSTNTPEFSMPLTIPATTSPGRSDWRLPHRRPARRSTGPRPHGLPHRRLHQPRRTPATPPQPRPRPPAPDTALLGHTYLIATRILITLDEQQLGWMAADRARQCAAPPGNASSSPKRHPNRQSSHGKPGGQARP